MRTVLPVLAGVVLTAGIAAAQYKTPPPPPPGQAPSGVQMAPNPNIQITQGSVEDPLMSARRIPRDEAIKWVKEEKAIFVDVRSKEAYDMGHIPGSISIPEPELISKLKEIPPHKFIITYCACPEEHTSARAVLDLNEHGIKNTACLLGGFGGWRQAGLPVITSNAKEKPGSK